MIKPAVRADLHSHTTASDGALTPTQLVQEAHKRGLTHIAISDHDTLAGIQEARQAAASLGITVIPSIELTCTAEGIEVHLLGIAVDPACAELITFAEGIRQRRHARYVGMVELLRTKCGLGNLTNEQAVPVKAGSLGRPELARTLMKLGYAKSVQDAFNQWLGKGMPAYIPNSGSDIADAVVAIRAARGVPILAHCGLYRDGEALAARLLECGVMGLEVFHPDHSTSRQQRLLDLVRSRNALLSGGADFHEFETAKAHYFGEVYIEADDLERIYEATRQ